MKPFTIVNPDSWTNHTTGLCFPAKATVFASTQAEALEKLAIKSGFASYWDAVNTGACRPNTLRVTS